MPAVPDGWTGFFSLYDGLPSTPPSCDSTFPTTSYSGNSQLSAAPAVCSTCSCGGPAGQTCDFADPTQAIVINAATCTENPNCIDPLDVPAAWNGACYGPSGDGAPSGSSCGAGSNCATGTQACNVSAQATMLQAEGGSCTASTQTPTPPTVSWGELGLACGGAAPGTGCGAGSTCLPIPQSPFVAGVCISQVGDIPCPSGAFSDQHLFYGGADDDRSCSDCTCGDPSGASCSATVTLYSAASPDTCTTAVATLNPTSAAADCVNLVANPSIASRAAVFGPVSGGTCAADGGVPTGTASPANPTTFCCIP